MKLYFIFFTLVTRSALAADFQVSKITEKGIKQIDIHATDTASKTDDPEKSISAVEAKRATIPWAKSRWPKLAEKENIKIVMIGDSGCRLKEGKVKSEYQDCKDPKAWPFPDIMKHIGEEKADLVIHVGDYHYRENCSKGKPCEKMSSVIGYTWDPWEKDFFTPASEVLKSTPWIIVRGNHEDCNRAYLGYAHLLANDDFSKKCLEYEEPDYIQLKNLLIVNLDSSMAPDIIDIDKDNQETWVKRFDDIAQKVKETKAEKVWIVTHKPFYGLVKLGPMVAPTNVNLKKYFEVSKLKGKVELILSGHVHLSQIIKSHDAPLQFVLGNGGTEMDKFVEVLETAKLKLLELDSAQIENPGFGYAVFEKNEKAKSWSVHFKNEKGNLVSACTFKSSTGTCEKN